jgi:hypothetical protein
LQPKQKEAIKMMRSLEHRSGCVAAAVLCVVSMVATLVAVGKAPVRISVELAGPGSITGQGSIQPLSPTAADPYRARSLQVVPARRPETKGDAPAPHGGTPQNRTGGGSAEHLDGSISEGGPSSTAGDSSGQPVGRRNLPPILMVSTGCGQSSILVRLLRILVEAAGYPVYDLHAEALHKKHKIRFMKPGMEMKQAVEEMLADANRKGQTVVQKLSQKTENSVVDRLIAEQAKVVLLRRGNILDRLVCRVRDCFAGSKIGFPVDDKGAKSDMCFGRRKEEKKRTGKATKARLNTEGLLKRLNAQKEEQESLRQWAKGP